MVHRFFWAVSRASLPGTAGLVNAYLAPGKGPAGQERRKTLSLLFYGVFSLVVVLIGLVLLVTFSLMVMAQKADNYLDQLECNLRQGQDCPPSSVQEAESPSLSGLAEPKIKLV
jgi:hypothetical protein